MGYQFTIGEGGEIPIPNEYCEQLGIDIGDILLCRINESTHKLELTKHVNQSLSDEEVDTAKDLTRVFELEEKS